MMPFYEETRPQCLQEMKIDSRKYLQFVAIDLCSLKKITLKSSPTVFTIDILPEIFNKCLEFITH